MRVAADNSFARVLNPHGGAYILSSSDRLFRSIYIYIYIYILMIMTFFAYVLLYLYFEVAV